MRVGNIKATKLLTIFILSILLLSTVSAYDLSDYPDMFIESGEFRGNFIVGDHANPMDVVSMIEIAVTMQAAGQELGGRQISVTASKLASEVKDISSKDAILVGTPCENEWIPFLMKADSCENTFDLKMREGVIEYMQKYDNHYLIVSGNTARDVRMASKVVANYWKHPEMNGYEVIVSPTRIIATKVDVTPVPQVINKPVIVGHIVPVETEEEDDTTDMGSGIIVITPENVKPGYETISVSKHSVLRKLSVPAEPAKSNVFIIRH